MEIGQLAGFVLATAVLVGIPGPNNLYISLRSLAQGRRAGVVSALAVETGTFVYAVVAALGLVALVQAAPALFTVISLAGAGYLGYLGVRAFRSKDSTGPGGLTRQSLGRVFRDGVVVNLLNPKSALFFLAFLPQFTSRDASPDQLRLELLGLGLGVMLIGLTLDLCYAYGAAALSTRFRRGRPGLKRYAVASVYLVLAGSAAFAALH